MQCRGIRGATTVEQNDREHLLAATSELLLQMLEGNGLGQDDIACIFFSTTKDLNADFPAVAAREGLGWTTVPLSCMHEMDVPGAILKCLRIMMLCNTDKKPEEIVHVYTRGAAQLRTRGALVRHAKEGK
ncbi:MAG: chorismate mutase [Chloroflexi bacterium]|nr:chorismate mutase [Chloroflexota bacterium]